MNPNDSRPVSTRAMVAAVRYHKNADEEYQPQDMVSDHNNRSWIKASAIWNAKRRFKYRVSLNEFVHRQNGSKIGRPYRRPRSSMALSKLEQLPSREKKHNFCKIHNRIAGVATNTILTKTYGTKAENKNMKLELRNP
jgi:hypothetical protein